MDEMSPPVLVDTVPAHQYTTRLGRRLEQRGSFAVDHSIRAQAFNERVRFLIVHYTDGNDASALRALTGSDVSVHYLVLDHPARWAGQPVVLQLLDEKQRAWHAGVSQWGDRHHLNDTSIGIEIVNEGYHETPAGRVWSPFSEDQIELVIRLAQDIVRRYHIDPAHVLAHGDVAPGRKVDPGPFFPWRRLHEAGIGAWPRPSAVMRWRERFQQHQPDGALMHRALAAWGYAVPDSHDAQALQPVIRAFQLHFRPTEARGVIDTDTAARLFALIERYQGRATAMALLEA
ncbi:N-acetylmuramoyl-L-alanine amidase [Kushneria phosphatilytica]|uniref:N-acetylmuramoyl-L-alanine amidase n=1 Tax=Kushneria phosphatilytica TaxID=657387 RepID=A0A5C1A6N5_9GAMM|nr:N-acetylmuramoyl-L-alanine amidase [Kushneria phosphatilytica]QEL12585.1 N-acetylmuramoyl-L-alanine amidase [Kushneria phosphatilytica]